MKTLKLFTILAIFVTLIGCSTNQPSNSRSNSSKSGEIKRGVKPIPDSEVAVIEMENGAAYGKITIELYSNIAPLAVQRFKELAREGVYDGTTFHRVNVSVIQGGDPLSKDNIPQNDGTGKSNKPDVPAEFSDIPYDIGIVGAARSQDPNSANSQFFITRKRESDFDTRYTVFGKVIDGMNNVTTIGSVPREIERPSEDVRIKTITIQPRQ